MWLGLGLMAATLTLAAPAGTQAMPDVTAMAVAGQRVTIELSAPVEFRIFPLAGPDRIVIDLPEVRWRVPPGAPASGLGADGPVQGLRYGLFQPGLSRIVLDLTTPVLVRQAFLAEPGLGHSWRVTVDLAPATRAQFSDTVRAGQADQLAAIPPSGAALPAGAPQHPATSATVPASPQTPVAPRRGERRVVVIDPGHGGIDPGTTSVTGQFEKTITLAYAQEIKRTFEATGRYRLVLTRERDETVGLRRRFQLARDAGAELFVSLHADAIGQASLRGGSVYTLSDRASDAEAEALAQKENKADVIAGIDLTEEPPAVAGILIDLAQRETMAGSARFARLLLAELDREQAPVLRKGHRAAGFAVLKAPDLPSVLYELGYLSNRQDEALIRQERHRKRVAQAMLRAVDRFFGAGKG
jgi:N-acetylmuramoyl-L-alanine amidase